MGTSASRFNPQRDLPDLTGRVAIVTGANAGIGLYTVLHLVRRGAKVYLGARSEAKASRAIDILHREGLGPLAGETVWLNLDLSDPRAARKAAQDFLVQESRLDILVNNAGKIISPYGLTEDGISDSMVINHLSPAAFTNMLLPLMKETASRPGSDVRIITLSSMSHRWIQNPRYDSLARLNSDFSSTRNPKTTLYAYTKLANILWTSELQRRFDAENIPILAISVHPGYVLSDGNVKLFSSLPMGTLLVWLAKLWFVTADIGAHNSVFAAASPKVKASPGAYKAKYLVPVGKVEEPSADAQRSDLAKELWETTEKVLASLDFKT